MTCHPLVSRRLTIRASLCGITAAIFLLAGCAKPLPPAPERVTKIDGAEYYVHQVRFNGESADIIAAWYLGSKDRKSAVLSLNPHVGAKSLTLTIGTPVLLLRKDILQNDPLPEDFVTAMRPPPVKKVTKKVTKPAAKKGGKKPAVTPALSPESPVVEPADQSQQFPPVPTSAPTAAPSIKKDDSPNNTLEDKLLEDLLGK